MSEEERSKIMTDLEEINELRKQESHPDLDISKSLYDHFPEDYESPGEEEFRQLTLLRDQIRLNGDESDDSVSIEDIEDDPAAYSASSLAFRRILTRRARNQELSIEDIEEDANEEPSIEDTEEDTDGISGAERAFRILLAREEAARLNEQSDESSVDPPGSDLDTDDELFG